MRRCIGNSPWGRKTGESGLESEAFGLLDNAQGTSRNHRRITLKFTGVSPCRQRGMASMADPFSPGGLPGDRENSMIGKKGPLAGTPTHAILRSNGGVSILRPLEE